MSRWAAGTRGAGVTSTLRPMIEASTRRAPHRGAVQDDGELDLAVGDAAVVGDGGERADVGAGDHAAGADDGRAHDARAAHPGALVDLHPPDDLTGVVDVALDVRLSVLQDGAVDLQHVADAVSFQ